MKIDVLFYPQGKSLSLTTVECRDTYGFAMLTPVLQTLVEKHTRIYIAYTSQRGSGGSVRLVEYTEELSWRDVCTLLKNDPCKGSSPGVAGPLGVTYFNVTIERAGTDRIMRPSRVSKRVTVVTFDGTPGSRDYALFNYMRRLEMLTW